MCSLPVGLMPERMRGWGMSRARTFLDLYCNCQESHRSGCETIAALESFQRRTPYPIALRTRARQRWIGIGTATVVPAVQPHRVEQEGAVFPPPIMQRPAPDHVMRQSFDELGHNLRKLGRILAMTQSPRFQRTDNLKMTELRLEKCGALIHRSADLCKAHSTGKVSLCSLIHFQQRFRSVRREKQMLRVDPFPRLDERAELDDLGVVAPRITEREHGFAEPVQSRHRHQRLPDFLSFPRLFDPLP